ncbi:MAG: PASTA domain-containing protein [Clostridiales bacterium]|jgi:stage V sporulation protein D (sporulation-specific penicillin-binding protein)|nr:PASTA domain-containing protein [Clostridiales bacterium]
MKLVKPYTLLTLQKRLLALIVSVTFLFVALMGRLAYIQLIDGAELQAKAADQWMRELPLKAPRGNVYDAGGRLLAGNYTVYSIYARPKSVADPDRAAAALSDALNLDREALRGKIAKKGVSEVTVAREVEKETADKLKLLNLPGIYFSEDTKRRYPYGDFLTQVLGYTNVDGDGQAGLEAYYDQYLKGLAGFSLTQTDIQGTELADNVTQYIPSVPGFDLRLTIDYNIQAFCEAAMEAAAAQYDPLGASALVLDAETGAVLAMTTKKSFDLNDPPRDDIAELMSRGKNKMVSDVYEPGSTFKIFTMAAAIEERRVKLDERFFCPGYRIVDGQRIKCWRTAGHGSKSFTEGVNVSCNCVFMDLAQRLGVHKYYEYLNKFGFGQSTGIDFHSESRGIVMKESSVKTVDLARIGFGQAVAVTPLQLAAGVAAAVNGGRLMTPYLVKEIAGADGKPARLFNPVEKRRVIGEESSAAMRAVLEEAVRVGSGKNAYIPGYKIGGKTGTAQKYADGRIAQGKYVSSFVGFAPADKPKYVVLISIDEPKGYAYYGSIVAAPWAKEIFGKLFAYKGIQPVFDDPKQIEDYKTAEMPLVIGKKAAEAGALIEAAGLQYEIDGEGSVILQQMPPAGTKLPVKSVVLIKTD